MHIIQHSFINVLKYEYVTYDNVCSLCHEHEDWRRVHLKKDNLNEEKKPLLLSLIWMNMINDDLSFFPTNASLTNTVAAS